MVAKGVKGLNALAALTRELRRDAVEAIARAGSGHPLTDAGLQKFADDWNALLAETG